MEVLRYFAYGSNMNPVRVADRGLVIVEATGGSLSGYRLKFNKQSRDHEGIGHANVVYAPGTVVEGVVYELADVHEIHKMDPYESAPVNYGRDVVPIETAQGQVWCWTYFANKAVVREGLRPSQAYLEHLLAGRDHLSSDYVDGLARTVTV